METVAIAAVGLGAVAGAAELYQGQQEGKALAKQYEQEADLAEKQADVDVAQRSEDLKSVLNDQQQWFAKRGGDPFSGSAAAATRAAQSGAARERQLIRGNAALNARQLTYAGKVKKSESRYGLLTGSLGLAANTGMGAYGVSDMFSRKKTTTTGTGTTG